jgi:beta-fructofuranosidase
MWGSIYERVGLDDESDWTYAGDFGAPRELRSRADGSLTVSLPEEVAVGFGTVTDVELDPRMGTWNVGAGTAEVDAVATLGYALASLPAASGPLLVSCRLRANEDGGPFGVLLRPADDLSQAHGLLFDPQSQTVVLTMWPQPLDPFWASLTSAKTPPAQIDGPRLVERPLEIRPGQDISCTILLDGSLVEAFVNDEVALSYRLYNETPAFGVFAQDAKVSVSDLKISQ